ncbi:MAG: proton-conducting transporter membrane subunit [Pseudomonadota bacterium]
MHAFLTYIAPLLFSSAAVLAFRSPGFRPTKTLVASESVALIAFAFSSAGLILLVTVGSASTPTIGFEALGLAARLDIVSALMALLVCGVGWVVTRFSASYLDGDKRQGAFTAYLMLTLASVLLFVQAGSLLQLILGALGTNHFLGKLLLFYPERRAAQRAVRKRSITAAAGMLFLISSAVFLVIQYGTGDMAAIMNAAQEGSGGIYAFLAAACLAVSALFMSAQFPTHGWLTEVMEAPTPVSALLHAGVINAGGFLLIRFADVMLLAPSILAILVIIGGFTAMLGALVMLTSSAVKTSLAWSTVSQMGFMILQCGLALFPIALLHILAHSLYKAHAFLASGSAVEVVASIKRPGPVAIPNAWSVLQAFLAALAVYVLLGLTFGFAGKSPQAIALGAVLIFGVAYLLAQGFADKAPRELTLRTGAAALGTTIAYFVLQTLIYQVTAGALPVAPNPGPLEWALIVLMVLSFGLVAWAQSTFPLWAYHPAAAGLRVHLSNGLYANALFDRLIGGWSMEEKSNASAAARS